MKEIIRLILADVDGTLLNDKKELTERTRQAICRLHEHGILFGIASGRSPYAVRHLVYEWGIGEATDLIVGFNGAATLDCRSGEMTFALPMSGQAIPEMHRDFAGFRYNIGIYDEETFHVEKDDPRAQRTAQLNRFALVVDDLSGYVSGAVPKALMMADPEELDRILEHYAAMKEPVWYRMFRSANDRTEVVNPELTKSKGIALLCERLGLNAEEVMTFGDMRNDYEMIRDYVGVAMGNAEELIKSAARYITASNEEDGIGVFLEEQMGI